MITSATQQIDLHQPKMIKQFILCGLALLIASILYLIAGNWFMLPNTVKLLIPQVFLMCFACISVWLSRTTWLHDEPLKEGLIQGVQTGCGVMLGLSLAVIGQVYQTGADSYLLFTVWAVLLLPWLYRHNIGNMLLFCIVSQLAGILYINQVHSYQHEHLLILMLNVLTGLQGIFIVIYYPKLRYILSLWVSIIAIISALLVADDGHEYHLYYVVSMFMLPMALIYYFYHKQQNLALVLSSIGLGGAICTWVIIEIINNIYFSESMLLWIGFIIFALFSIIAFLIYFFVKSSNHHAIPLAVGAWLSGLFFSAFFLTFFKTTSMILGLFCLIIAVLFLIPAKSLFVRQLGYCMMMTGQTAFLTHLAIEYQQPWLMLEVTWVVIVWLIYQLRPMHWLLLAGQLVALYLISLGCSIGIFEGSTEYFKWVEFAVFSLFSLFMGLVYFLKSEYRLFHQRGVVFGLILINLLSFLIDFNMDFNIVFAPNIPLSFMVHGALVLWISYLLFKQNKTSLLMMIVFGLVVSYFNYFALFMLMVLIFWSLSKQDKLMYSVSLVAFGGLLWHLYYSLELIFLVKSFSIFISGIMCFALAWLLHKQTQEIFHE